MRVYIRLSKLLYYRKSFSKLVRFKIFVKKFKNNFQGYLEEFPVQAQDPKENTIPTTVAVEQF